jgi:hypothetical protein
MKSNIYIDDNKWSDITNNFTYDVVSKENFTHNNMFETINSKSN